MHQASNLLNHWCNSQSIDHEIVHVLLPLINSTHTYTLYIACVDIKKKEKKKKRNEEKKKTGNSHAIKIVS